MLTRPHGMDSSQAGQEAIIGTYIDFKPGPTHVLLPVATDPSEHPFETESITYPLAQVKLAEAHWVISDTYGKMAISGGGDFAVEDRHGGGREKVIKEAELEASDS
nr:Mariner Mos1 transposase [Hymenolepis microstoma]